MHQWQADACAAGVPPPRLRWPLTQSSVARGDAARCWLHDLLTATCLMARHGTPMSALLVRTTRLSGNSASCCLPLQNSWAQSEQASVCVHRQAVRSSASCCCCAPAQRAARRGGAPGVLRHLLAHENVAGVTAGAAWRLQRRTSGAGRTARPPHTALRPTTAARCPLLLLPRPPPPRQWQAPHRPLQQQPAWLRPHCCRWLQASLQSRR